MVNNPKVSVYWAVYLYLTKYQNYCTIKLCKLHEITYEEKLSVIPKEQFKFLMDELKNDIVCENIL